MQRSQVEALLPELTFVAQAVRKSKRPEMLMGLIKNAIDWGQIDEAGNNLEVVMRALRDGVKRATT